MSTNDIQDSSTRGWDKDKRIQYADPTPITVDTLSHDDIIVLSRIFHYGDSRTSSTALRLSRIKEALKNSISQAYLRETQPATPLATPSPGPNGRVPPTGGSGVPPMKPGEFIVADEVGAFDPSRAFKSKRQIMEENNMPGLCKKMTAEEFHDGLQGMIFSHLPATLTFPSGKSAQVTISCIDGPIGKDSLGGHFKYYGLPGGSWGGIPESKPIKRKDNWKFPQAVPGQPVILEPLEPEPDFYVPGHGARPVRTIKSEVAALEPACRNYDTEFETRNTVLAVGAHDALRWALGLSEEPMSGTLGGSL